jgi:hypothetical protein
MHNAQSSGPESGTATGSNTGIDTCTRTVILSPISARCSGYGVAAIDVLQVTFHRGQEMLQEVPVYR